jgi:hypothetical protein
VTLATVMGSMMALALSKFRFKGNSGFVDIFLVLPLTTPEIVLGCVVADDVRLQRSEHRAESFSRHVHDRDRAHAVLPVASWRSR